MGNKKAREFMKQREAKEAWDKARYELRRLEDDVFVPAIGRRRVQVAHAPSFEPGFAWEIRELRGNFSLFRSHIVEVCFYTKLKGYQRLDVSSDVLQDYLHRLRQISLSISPAFMDRDGLDGTTYQLALFGDLHSNVRFVWWSKPPEQWRALVGLTEKMIEEFSKANEMEDLAAPGAD
jgi:hypothetical protein